MEIDKIKSLLAKYYQGETSLEEEQWLRENLQPGEKVPVELKGDAELFAMMQAVENDRTDQEIDLEKQPAKEIPLRPSTNMSFTWISRIAAGFALLIVGAFIGWLIGQGSGTNGDIMAIRQDLNEMKELVALSQLRNESASERIMATYQFKKLDSASDEILDALIYTFNNDDNPNVKNAAAEALFKFGNHDKVRKAFINGLTSQTDPVLQIKLIEMLVGLNEKRALPKLQQMMEQESQMMVVKQKAAEGIGRLL
jgi:hypothetical protein